LKLFSDRYVFGDWRFYPSTLRPKRISARRREPWPLDSYGEGVGSFVRRWGKKSEPEVKDEAAQVAGRERGREARGFRVYACSAIASSSQAHVAF
jgi:hypothetical protein